MNNDAFVKNVASRLIEQIRNGTAPWQKPWRPGTSFVPFNPTNGTRYKGINVIFFWRAATAMRAVLSCLLGFVATRTTGDRAFPARSQQSPHIVWFWSDDAGCWGIPFSSGARDALGATIVLDCDRN
jgi:hypothetical protein